MRLSDRVPLLAVIGREVGRIASSPLQLMLMVVLPLASAAWLLAIFDTPMPRDLPMLVVDLDRRAASSTVVRMLDETPTIRIVGDVSSLDEAARVIRSGSAYGAIVVPHGFASDLMDGRSPAISVFHNTQWLLASSLIVRDAQVAVLTASAGAELAALRARGAPRASVRAVGEPIVVRTHTLANPQLNYHHYLLAALLPAVLQMFAAMAMAIGLGSEFKDRTSDAWLTAAHGSLARAFVGKFLVHTAWFMLLAVAMLALLFDRLGMPMRGHPGVLLAASWLFVAAVQAVACALVALTAGLRLAASLVAFYTGIAFPFIGVTFPAMAMPVLARTWAECLPLTHFVRALTDHGLRGPIPGHDAHTLLALASFIVVAVLIGAWPLHRLVRGRRAWQDA